MEPTTRYTVVGAVVLVLIAAIVLSALWLSGFISQSSTKFFTVYFQDHSLSGLQIDSNVTMRGIKVGSVSDFEISSENIQDVKVVIKVEEDTPIKTDTEAIVTRNILTGLATIELMNGSQHSPSLTVVPSDERFPIIKEGKAPLERLAKNASSILENVDTTLERINNFLSDDNLNSLSSVIKNVENLSSSLARGSDRIEDTVKRIDQLFSDLSILADKLDSQASLIGDSLYKTMTQTMLQLSSLSGELSGAARSLMNTLDQFSDPKEILFGPEPQTLGPGEAEGGHP